MRKRNRGWLAGLIVALVSVGARADLSISEPVTKCMAHWTCAAPASEGDVDITQESTVLTEKECGEKLLEKVTHAQLCATPKLAEGSVKVTSTTVSRTLLTCDDGEGAQLCELIRYFSRITDESISGDAQFDWFIDTLWPVKNAFAEWVTLIPKNNYHVSPEIGDIARTAAQKICGLSWTGLTDARYQNIVNLTQQSSHSLAWIQFWGGISDFKECPDFR